MSLISNNNKIPQTCVITSLSKTLHILLICIMQCPPWVISLAISIHVMIDIAQSSTIILGKYLVLLEVTMDVMYSLLRKILLLYLET